MPERQRIEGPWKARSLRFTAFFDVPWDEAVPSSHRLWKAAFKEDPAAAERGVAGSVVMGVWEGGRAQTKIEAAGNESFRFDLLWESHWFLTDGMEILAAFSRLVEAVVAAGLPTATRLAVGAVGGWTTANRSAAYDTIGCLAPIRVNQDMQELTMRVNRPADIGLPTPVNRFATWACLVSTSKVPLPDGHPMRLEPYAAFCEVDVNTGVDYKGTWHGSDVLAVFTLLRQTAVDIIQDGYPA